MKDWSVAITLEPGGAGRQRLSDRIAAALRDAIVQGRLGPGQRLPGSRVLARQLGVHRNTVTAAYDMLDAEGWLQTEAARCRRVTPTADRARPLRMAFASRAGIARRVGFALGPEDFTAAPPEPPVRWDLRSGLPDPRLVPWEALSRAYRRVLKHRGPRLLGDAGPEGHLALRTQLAGMLAGLRGLRCEVDDLIVTRGSSMGLWLAVGCIVRPGDRVAVEALGYPAAFDVLRRHGAQLVPLPVDEDGLRVEALVEALREAPLRAVYLTPHHHYPTLATLGGPRRLQLLQLARAHRFAILEDDYDHEFHYEGSPVLPMAANDNGGNVIYLGTLSKVLAPGLRLGYVVAPPVLRRRMLALRASIDAHGDAALECAVAELMEDGELQRHVDRSRRHYMNRRDLLLEALGERLGGRVTARRSNGGLALWCRAHDVDVDLWAARAQARGLGFSPGSLFAADGRRPPFMRLGFGRCGETELRDAVQVLARAVPRAASRR